MPLISIITIALNAGEAIRRTLESIECQTFSDYEHLIIDGGSTDDTLSIIQEFYLPRTKVTSEKDNGITDAMNKGIKQSSGELIIHLGATDEFFSPDVLSKVAKSYQSFNWDWAIGSFQWIEEFGKLDHTVIINGFDYKVLRHGCFISHPGVFITRRVFERFGLFDESFLLSMDYEFWLRIGCHIKPYILPFIIDKAWAGGVSSKYMLRAASEMRRARAKNDPRNWLNTFLFEAMQWVCAYVEWFLLRFSLFSRWYSQLRKIKFLISGTTNKILTITDAK